MQFDKLNLIQGAASGELELKKLLMRWLGLPRGGYNHHKGPGKKNTGTRLLQNISAFPHTQFNLIQGLIYERHVQTRVFMCGEFLSTKDSLEYFFVFKKKITKN
jgi:hypothetical protein